MTQVGLEPKYLSRRWVRAKASELDPNPLTHIKVGLVNGYFGPQGVVLARGHRTQAETRRSQGKLLSQLLFEPTQGLVLGTGHGQVSGLGITEIEQTGCVVLTDALVAQDLPSVLKAGVDYLERDLLILFESLLGGGDLGIRLALLALPWGIRRSVVGLLRWSGMSSTVTSPRISGRRDLRT